MSFIWHTDDSVALDFSILYISGCGALRQTDPFFEKLFSFGWKDSLIKFWQLVKIQVLTIYQVRRIILFAFTPNLVEKSLVVGSKSLLDVLFLGRLCTTFQAYIFRIYRLESFSPELDSIPFASVLRFDNVESQKGEIRAVLGCSDSPYRLAIKLSNPESFFVK